MDQRLSLAIKYYQSGVDDQAQTLVDEILAEPNPPLDAINLAATLAFERRDLESAVSYCNQILAATPRDAHVLLLKGRALSDLNQQEEALVCLERAVTTDPNMAAGHYNLGWIRQRAGDAPGAVQAYRTAVAKQDPYPVAWNNLGLALEQLGDCEGAVDAFRTAVEQFPQFSPAHNNLGAALAAAGRYRTAAESYVAALESDPENVDARTNFGVALLEQGEIERAMNAFRDVLDLKPGHAPAQDNLLYAEMYRSDDAAGVVARHTSAGEALKAQFMAGEIVKNPDPNRALRVGFLSPDFRRHSVSFFALPLIEHLDVELLEPVLFSDVALPDAVTERYRNAASEWYDVAGQADDVVADIIRQSHVDVLIDLAGRTTGNRVSVLATRVAPIQITGIGYPGPIGIAAMDYWLCDAITNPSGEGDVMDHDRPLRMDRGFHIFAPLGHAPPVSPLPAASQDSITFGSFNKLAKISDETIALWASVLSAIPSSRLLLKAQALTEVETAAGVKARFVAHGVEEGRVECRGWAAEDRDHLALYQHVDIALDTFPYNGTTTTCEALWMGVPVLSLCGESHAARVGASLLTSAGLLDWIAASPEQFVAKAVARADDIAALTDLRSSLRATLADSVLCDGPDAVRSFEKAIRQAWQTLCGQLSK